MVIKILQLTFQSLFYILTQIAEICAYFLAGWSTSPQKFIRANLFLLTVFSGSALAGIYFFATGLWLLFTINLAQYVITQIITAIFLNCFVFGAMFLFIADQGS